MASKDESLEKRTTEKMAEQLGATRSDRHSSTLRDTTSPWHRSRQDDVPGR